jgi:hypothetical protein
MAIRPPSKRWIVNVQGVGPSARVGKANVAGHADSLDHIPMRYLLAFTAVMIATAHEYLSGKGDSPGQAGRMHAAFTQSMMLHVTVWTRPYADAAGW